jgi:hypothetical protein
MPHLRHNYIVNILDGAFFGFALGFASFITIIPLFISRFTDSAILIGLVPVLHTAGFQLPQLFTADLVSRQAQHKKLTLFFTVHERLPFLLMAGIAWISPHISPSWVLGLFCDVGLAGFGRFTANPGKAWLLNSSRRNNGTFLGLQGSARYTLQRAVVSELSWWLDSPWILHCAF